VQNVVIKYYIRRWRWQDLQMYMQEPQLSYVLEMARGQGWKEWVWDCPFKETSKPNMKSPQHLRFIPCHYSTWYLTDFEDCAVCTVECTDMLYTEPICPLLHRSKLKTAVHAPGKFRQRSYILYCSLFYDKNAEKLLYTYYRWAFMTTFKALNLISETLFAEYSIYLCTKMILYCTYNVLRYLLSVIIGVYIAKPYVYKIIEKFKFF
jgi:hypothetical protein